MLALGEIDVGEPQPAEDLLGQLLFGVALQEQHHVDDQVSGTTKFQAAEGV